MSEHEQPFIDAQSALAAAAEPPPIDERCKVTAMAGVTECSECESADHLVHEMEVFGERRAQLMDAHTGSYFAIYGDAIEGPFDTASAADEYGITISPGLS